MEKREREGERESKKMPNKKGSKRRRAGKMIKLGMTHSFITLLQIAFEQKRTLRYCCPCSVIQRAYSTDIYGHLHNIKKGRKKASNVYTQPEKNTFIARTGSKSKCECAYFAHSYYQYYLDKHIPLFLMNRVEPICDFRKKRTNRFRPSCVIDAS